MPNKIHLQAMVDSITNGDSLPGDTFTEFPTRNPDHVVNNRTLQVILGNRTFEDLIQEHLEDPLKEWINEGGQQLPPQALKGIATALKTKYGLDNLTIRGQVG